MFWILYHWPFDTGSVNFAGKPAPKSCESAGERFHESRKNHDNACANSMGMRQRVHSSLATLAPTIHVESLPEFDTKNTWWTASIRRIEASNEALQEFTVTFQIVSPRAPTHLLVPDLEFEFWEGRCVWKGIILEIFMAPKDPGYWYDN